ncbi:MAG TPA: low molecular weight phosphatase family protein [Nitrospira sp.]|nr:low molecular weight phosphatase family protein [Nitrospira sp.]
MTQSILFVCTGNIFRSMVAEYAVRAQIGSTDQYRVESAGIEATPQTIHPIIRVRLLQKGADPSAHVQRTLTRDVLERADFIIAMGQNHRAFIQEHFGRTAPLFNEVSFGRATPILDLHEAFPDWEQDLRRARDYVESIVDQIWDAAPALVTRLPHYLRPEDR